MTEQTKAPTFGEVEEAMLALRGDEQRVVLDFSKFEAWQIVSQLQLALRHPGNKGPTADYARHVLNGLRDAVAPDGILRQLFDAGWNPDEDVATIESYPRVPFREDMEELVDRGKKIATTRTTRIGLVGQDFAVRDKVYRFTLIDKLSLSSIATSFTTAYRSA